MTTHQTKGPCPVCGGPAITYTSDEGTSFCKADLKDAQLEITQLRETLKGVRKMLLLIRDIGPFSPGPVWMTPLEKCEQMAKDAILALNPLLEAEND